MLIYDLEDSAGKDLLQAKLKAFWRQRFAIMIAAVNAIISSSFLSSRIDACCCTRGGGTVWRAAKLSCSCIAAPSIIVGN
jgi:hypothetical protein